MLQPRRVCVWGGGGLSLTEVWDTLAQLQIPFSRVRRVSQRNGIRRFDYSIEASEVQKSVRLMEGMRWWRVRPDCKPAERPGSQRARPPACLVRKPDLKSVSWNIAGLEWKHLEVEYFLSLRKPDVISLQETNRRLSSREIEAKWILLHRVACG